MAPDDETGSGAEPPAGGDPAAGADPDTGSEPPSQPDFGWLPEQFRGEDGPDLEGFQAHYNDLAAEAGIRAEQLAAVPEDADGYELAIPEDIDYGEDLDLPDDYAVNLNVEDEAMAPVFGELKAFLHENKLPAEAGKQVMGMLAKYEARQFSQAMAAAREEMSQLGPQAEARMNKVGRALEGKLSEAQAKALKSAMRSADGVRALETLLATRNLGAPPAPKPKAPEDDLEAYYATPTR